MSKPLFYDIVIKEVTYRVYNKFEELYLDTYGSHGYELQYHPASNGKNEYYTINRPDGYVERLDSNGLLISITNLLLASALPTTSTNVNTKIYSPGEVILISCDAL